MLITVIIVGSNILVVRYTGHIELKYIMHYIYTQLLILRCCLIKLSDPVLHGYGATATRTTIQYDTMHSHQPITQCHKAQPVLLAVTV